MANDRNTFAKRQREMEKKRKAASKRERRANKPFNKTDEAEAPEQNPVLATLSPAEHAVLSVFRRYLMTPGKMLSLISSDLDALRAPLAGLTEKGLLVPEGTKGAYSLTEIGFDAMNDSA